MPTNVYKDGLKKILISVLLVILIFEFIMPNFVWAINADEYFNEGAKDNSETISQEENQEESQEENQEETEVINENEKSINEDATTGLDTIAGMFIEPMVKFVLVVVDSVMQIFTMFMTQNGFQSVMVGSIDDIHQMGEASATFTIESMDSYKNAFGLLDIKYPNFSYSSEEIFAGKLPLLEINFFNSENQDQDWNQIRNIIGNWYKVIRSIAIIGLLSILIYTGIKIIISSSSKDKAKYKEFIINWFMAVVLLFVMHYIMAFILTIIDDIMYLVGELNGVIEVTAGDETFKTNLIGLARFQIQQQNFTEKLGHLIIYIALVTFTFKFTFLYLKRVLKMAFLTVIAPIVALMYPIDKMDGKANVFEMWLKEYTFNALLQPMHYILYYVLVSSSLTLAARNPLYGIAALLFMSQAERLLKKIFGFDKARGGTVSGIAGAFATGAVVSAVNDFVQNPLGLFDGGASTKQNESDNNYAVKNGLKQTKDDTDMSVFLDDGISPATVVAQSNANLPIEGEEFLLPGIEGIMCVLRKGLSKYSIEELGPLNFNDDDSRSMEEILKLIAQYQYQLANATESSEKQALRNKIKGLKNILNERVSANEFDFKENGIPLQYGFVDDDKRSSSELLEDIMKYNKLAKTASTKEKRRYYKEKARHSLNVLNRRMAQNNYIHNNGGTEALLQKAQNVESVEMDGRINRIIQQNNESANRTVQSNNRSTVNPQSLEENKFKNKPMVKGATNVAKTIVKPVWNTEKSVKYNASNLTKKFAGLGIGIGLATVQAGISITDGKYNPLEGVATVGGTIVGTKKLTAKKGSILDTYYQDNEKEMKKYSEDWFNRDDVINEYNKAFPGKGKEMRRRAVNNYISRGITDFNEQKQAMKYAEKLKNEQGMSEDEADRIAIATLQYKQTMLKDGSYMVLYDLEKRDRYLDTKADAYKGSATSDNVRKVHTDFINNVLDFNKANE